MKNKKIKCPKCNSRFGVALIKNLHKDKWQIYCRNGDCDFSMNIVDWNNKYKQNEK